MSVLGKFMSLRGARSWLLPNKAQFFMLQLFFVFWNLVGLNWPFTIILMLVHVLFTNTHFLPYFYSLTNLFSSSVFSSNTFQSLDCLPLTTRTEILFLAVSISLWNVDWLYSSHFSPVCCQHHLHQHRLKLPFLLSVFSFSLSPPPFQAD